MQLSEQNRNTLMMHLHKCIEEQANHAANNILHGRSGQLTSYPPNGGFTPEEKEALTSLVGNEPLKSALRKAIASSSANVLFDLFNILDGTGNPDPGTGAWSEVMVVDVPEDFDEDMDMLHDHFFESYWLWRKKRKADWKLDLHEGDVAP